MVTPNDDDGKWRTALDSGLARLDVQQRTLVIEHQLMGMRQEALATRWRLSQSTVSRHLAQALERLPMARLSLGSDLSYGLRYQKFSDTRFRLEIDPASLSPAYADPSRLAGLVKSDQRIRRSDSTVPPIVILPTAWEADVLRLTESAAANVEFPNEDQEPVMPKTVN